MTTFTENAGNAAFILTEANGQRSRENGTLVSGQNLAAGTVLMDNGAGKLTALTASGTASELDGAAAGILINATDATLGDVGVSYIARDAEVNFKVLVAPPENTDGGQDAAVKASLLLLGIICRD